MRAEGELLEEYGIEPVEGIKDEINRELGKRLEKLMGKEVDFKSPDLTILVDLDRDSIRFQIRSLYVYGGYQKLVRGIPQSKWICSRCGGKGCELCKGRGKLYPTSVQEIIEKPLLKAAKAKASRFSGAGREDIDVRCLDYRPFVIELVEPLRRRIDLRKVQGEINKSKRVKVKGLKLVGKETVRKIKSEEIDKTYLATVDFEDKLDDERLRKIKELTKQPILQRTPLRVLHRRADRLRKRWVKRISYQVAGRKRLILKIRAESGLYIKELITGDQGRTKPNIAELIQNKPRKITLDVIKIHTK